jgi:hypothetical protein
VVARVTRLGEFSPEIVYSLLLLHNYKSIPNLWATFWQGQKLLIHFGQNMDWDTFWAILCLTHLVTLVVE